MYAIIIFSYTHERRSLFMAAEHEKWSSIEELAAHLKVHKDTIRLWIKKNEIPAHKIGKLWRFKISEIDDWVRSGKSAKIGSNAD